MTSINEAIEELEARKAFLMRTCAQCWDPSINLALNGLKLIEKYTEMLVESINESRLVYEADLDSDDLVDCENSTRVETYRTCLEMFNYLKQSIMNIGGQNNEL